MNKKMKELLAFLGAFVALYAGVVKVLEVTPAYVTGALVVAVWVATWVYAQKRPVRKT